MTMDFDEILEELGEMGKFQITTYFLVCLPVFFAAANSLSYVFTAGVPDYRCIVPGCDDLLEPKYKEPWVKWAIPNDGSSAAYQPSHCERFIRNETAQYNNCSRDEFIYTIKERCHEWIFDKERTIVNDWKITCLENQWKLSLVGSSHFAGIIFGSAIFGVLADRYGRKIIFIFCIMLMSVSGVVQVFAPEYISFTTFVFINALGTAGVYPLAFIIGVEMVGRKKREVTGMILNYFYAMGEAVVGLIAYFAQDWVYLQLAVSAPPILFIVYCWVIPESVRWLLAKERNIQAKGIVCKVAKVNKVVLSESLLNSFELDQNLNKNIQEGHEEIEIWPILKRMCKSTKLIIRFTIVFFIWAVSAFVFYGLSVNSTSMSGNKYINYTLVCLVEIPGYSLAWVCIKKFGRRRSLIGSFFISGLTCTCTVFIPTHAQWAVTLLAMTGKIGVTSVFGVLYVHTSEMLPTIVRSGGVGAASTMARVGALAAPFVPLLGAYVQPLPMLLFGGMGILAGLLALKLPETLGTKLPETAEEAEKL